MKKTKIQKIIKIINDLMKKGCDRFEPDVCSGCKKAVDKIKILLR